MAGQQSLQSIRLEPITMSRHAQNEAAVAFAMRRPLPWRTIVSNAIDLVQSCIRRRRERQELLDYIASDHRAAADIGISAHDAHAWAKRPFWRA